MKNLPSIKRYKTFFKIDYKPKLSFYNVLINAADSLKSYSDWETNILGVSLKDFKNHCSVGIKHKYFAYTQDSGDMAIEEKKIRELLDNLPIHLNISQFTRMGYRTRSLIEIDMKFDSLVEVMEVKLASPDYAFQKLLPGEIKDIAYTYEMEGASQSYRLQIGPVKKQEIQPRLELTPENFSKPIQMLQDELPNYPDTAIFIDFDIYLNKADIALDKIESFLISARKENETILKDIRDYIFKVK